jgi:hypothetical protein
MFKFAYKIGPYILIQFGPLTYTPNLRWDQKRKTIPEIKMKNVSTMIEVIVEMVKDVKRQLVRQLSKFGFNLVFST